MGHTWRLKTGPQRIDVLLGAEFYHQLLSVGHIKGLLIAVTNLSTLQNTVFGWVLAGKVNQEETTHVTCGVFSEDEEYIQELIERFWKLDEVDYAQSALTVAEKRCEAHFAQHNTRRSEGRFVVRLPFVDNPSTLEESTQMTLNRFFALEKRLAKNTVIKAQYVEFMNEYESLGHMTRIDPKNVLPAHYFILHHYVLKPDTSTT